MEKKKIKIMHILDSLETGGMENGVVNICNRIDRAIFEPMICCLRHIGSLAKRLQDDVNLINMKFSDKNVYMRPFKLVSTFRNENPTIVHTHGWGGGSFEGIIAAKMARIPVVINGEHGRLFLKPFQVRLQKLLAKLCDTRLSVSASLKDEIADRLGIPGETTTIIPNGVDVELFNGKYDTTQLQNELSTYANTKLNKGDFIIGSIGSLKPEKNQMLLLEALRKLSADENMTKFKILFIGDGPDRVWLQKYVSLYKLDNNIIFMGLRHDIPHLLSLIDILVSTSIAGHEGMSNVILEAMSSGVPVIATKSVGTAELVESGLNGYLIETGDAITLANKINFLFKNTQVLKKMGEYARQFVIGQYSIEKMIAAYQDLYLEKYSENI